MPESLHRFFEARVNEAEFGTVSEYFRVLIREDKQRQLGRLAAASRYPTHNSPTPTHRPLASAARRK